MKKLIVLILAIMVLPLCLSSCFAADEEPDGAPDDGVTDDNNNIPEDPTPEAPTPEAPTPEAPTPEEPVVHTHTYSDVWTYDETDHWHKATCTDTQDCQEAVKDKASHDFTSGDECICGYKKPVEAPKPEILGALNSDYGIRLSNGTKIDVNYYPGFVRKAVTFTIDDGNTAMDRAFLNIVRPAGIKGTFNLCSVDVSKAAELVLLYEGYEVANHHQLHCLNYRDNFDYSKIELKDEVFSSTSDPAYMYKDANVEGLYYIDYRQYSSAYTSAYWHPIATNETYTKYIDITKYNIEEVFGEGSVVGFAYPHGAVNAYVKQYLKDAGYLYARDTGSLLDKTGFSLPEDRFTWTYNADNTNLLDVMAKYDAYADDGELKFFSFGVHASDYKNSWDMLSEFAEKYGNRTDEFYYATNREIFEYEDAVKALDINEERIINNSQITVYITVNNVKVKLPAGATLNLSDIEAEAPESEITFENVVAENLPSPLMTNLTSTVAKEIGVLISEVCGSKKLVLKTGNDGADTIAVKLTAKTLNYNAVTLKSDVTLDTDGENVSFMLNFKTRAGAIVHQMTLNASVGRVSFSDYYKKPGAISGEYTFSSEQGYTTEIAGREFTMVLEISKNEENRTILKIFANGRFVAESTHSALADVALEDIASFEFTSVTASEGSLMLDNLSLKRTKKIEEPAKDELAEIMPVKGGAGGIVVLVHDDGDLASAALLDSIYEKYGIVGDVALIANRVWNAGAGAPIVAAQQGWQALLDNGRWGLINHSFTHEFWGTSVDGQLTIDEDMLYNEIVTSGEILRQVFPNERVLTFAYPGLTAITNVHGKMPVYKKAVSLVLEHYAGARNYSGGTIPIDKTVHAYANGRTLEGGASDYHMIDVASANNNILVFLMHRVVESNPTGNAITSSVVEGIARYISEYVDEGKVWSAHFEDAMLYTKEARYAAVSSSVDENGIKLNVTDNLDDNIYNYPLTVKVKVSSDWEAVKLTQGERTFYAVTKTEGDETYALVDVVPDGGEAIVTSYAKADVPEEFIPVVKPPHEHTYSETYTYDTENHWKAATCDAKIACATATNNKAAHELDENGKCACGYEKTPGYYDTLGGLDFTNSTGYVAGGSGYQILDGLVYYNTAKGNTSYKEGKNFSILETDGDNKYLTMARNTSWSDMYFKKQGDTEGNCYVFEANVRLGLVTCTDVQNGPTLFFASSYNASTTAPARTAGKTFVAKVTDGAFSGYEFLGQPVETEKWYTVTVEYYTEENLVKYYLNGVCYDTAVLDTETEMLYFGIFMNNNALTPSMSLDNVVYTAIDRVAEEKEPVPEEPNNYYEALGGLDFTNSSGYVTGGSGYQILDGLVYYNTAIGNTYVKAGANYTILVTEGDNKYLTMTRNTRFSDMYFKKQNDVSGNCYVFEADIKLSAVTCSEETNGPEFFFASNYNASTSAPSARNAAKTFVATVADGAFSHYTFLGQRVEADKWYTITFEYYTDANKVKYYIDGVCYLESTLDTETDMPYFGIYMTNNGICPTASFDNTVYKAINKTYVAEPAE